MIQALEVGKPLPFKIKEGTQMEYDSSGIMYFINIPEVKPSEIKAVESGKLEMCLYIEQPVIFALMKVSGCIDWSDAPYNINLTRSPVDLSHDFKMNEGLSTMIILHDSRKGIIKAMRLIASDAEFANIFISSIKDQISIPFDQNQYNAKISQVYGGYTCDDMLQRGKGYFRIKRD